MRPGALGPLGAVASAAASGAAAATAGGKGAAEGGSKADPEKEAAAERGPAERREGPPGGGRYSGRREDMGYDAWADRERYERERDWERYEGRGGPRGPPFGRDGPPPFMYRDGPRGPPDFRWAALGCLVWGGWAGASCWETRVGQCHQISGGLLMGSRVEVLGSGWVLIGGRSNLKHA